jgi:hypothetical protein
MVAATHNFAATHSNNFVATAVIYLAARLYVAARASAKYQELLQNIM